MKGERIVNRIPVPMCVVDPNGKIKDFNGMINQVFIYDDIRDYDFFALTGIRIDDLSLRRRMTWPRQSREMTGSSACRPPCRKMKTEASTYSSWISQIMKS